MPALLLRSNIFVISIAGESELYDAETPIDLFFGQVLSVKFNEYAPLM